MKSRRFSKFKEMLSEAPRIIHIQDSDIETWLRDANEYYIRNKHKFKPTDTEGLFRSGTNEGYYVFVVNDIVEYFIKYTTISYTKLLNGHAIKEVVVARNKMSVESAGIAQKVLFDYLIPEYGYVITDTLHSDNGRSFWTYAVTHALKHPEIYNVLVLDRKSTPNQVVPITTKSDMSKMMPYIWGNENSYERMLIAIGLNEFNKEN